LIRHILREHLMSMNEGRRYSDEDLQNIALRYGTKIDFVNNDRNAYTAALRRGILDNITKHMTPGKSYYTDEDLQNIASRYQHKKDFIKNDGKAYAVAKQRKILDKITQHMSPVFKYSDEELRTRAKEFKHRSEFKKFDKPAYSAAYARGILDDITTHMTPLGNLYNRLVYVYEFPQVNAVYVGITYHEDRRKKGHMKIDSNSSVRKFMDETHLEPEYKVVSDGYVDYQQAQKLEGDLVEKYKNEGWQILNKVKTGGLGGSFKLSDEVITDIAKKYKFKSDFRKNEPKAFKAAAHRGLLKNLSNLENKPLQVYSDEDLEEIAKKYQHKGDFYKNDKNAYQLAHHRGILDSITTHMVPKTKYTFDELKKIASKYTTKKDFREKDNPAFQAAKGRGILQDITKHMTPLRRKTK